jgi:hypothetical protein
MLMVVYRWLDVTPNSRVITRCTQDIQASKYRAFFMTDFELIYWLIVDGTIANMLIYLCEWISSFPLSC